MSFSLVSKAALSPTHANIIAALEAKSHKTTPPPLNQMWFRGNSFHQLFKTYIFGSCVLFTSLCWVTVEVLCSPPLSPSPTVFYYALLFCHVRNETHWPHPVFLIGGEGHLVHFVHCKLRIQKWSSTFWRFLKFILYCEKCVVLFSRLIYWACAKTFSA